MASIALAPCSPSESAAATAGPARSSSCASCSTESGVSCETRCSKPAAAAELLPALPLSRARSHSVTALCPTPPASGASSPASSTPSTPA
eukprot:5915375-Prymnesium_polylepis.1